MKLPTLDFVGKRKFFIIVSLALIIMSLILSFTLGFEFGIDFSGGSELTASIDENIGSDRLRSILTEINTDYSTAKIIELSPIAGQEDRFFFSITLPESFGTEASKSQFENSFVSYFEGMNYERLAFDDVSGYAAQEIRQYAWYAVIIALVLLLAYITLRFKFSFGVGALTALAHDIIIVIGFYSLFRVEIDVAAIAAFLTLAGYSLNDTIVIYDRIRENMKNLRGVKIEEIVNRSLNEVITRSVNTSLTTFIIVFLLFVIGGRALAPFAFGLTIGVLVGTYSSLFIASPLVIEWIKRTAKRA